MAKKTITITIKAGEIMYDVANKTGITGDARQTGDNYEQVSYIKAANDEESLNQIRRSIGGAFVSLLNELAEYLTSDEQGASNALQPAEDYVIELQMPMNWNEAANESVANAMHNYITNVAMGEWLNMTDKADGAEYFGFAAKNLAELRTALNKRVRPQRPASAGLGFGLGLGH